VNRKPFWLFTLLFLVAGSSAEAQQPAQVHRIGYMSVQSLGSEPVRIRIEAFRQGLRGLGYIEGKTIAIEWRSAMGKPELLPDLAAELVRLKVDIIVTDGALVTRAAKNATKTIPIVMASDADPIESGYIASLARPGGNITGLTNLVTGLSGKRLELLKEASPGISRVGVIWNPESPPSAAAFKETQIAAQPLGLQLQSLEVRGANFEGAFQAATKGRAKALTVLSDALMDNYRLQILELEAKHKLPTIYGQSQWVEDGGLMSYGTYFPDLWRRAATYVDKILKGTKPADLPVEQPMKFEFVINLKTAKQIGLTIPPNVLARADRVIR
jgi:putative tryptophan/tyrosine transport system substrate-binding protein